VDFNTLPLGIPPKKVGEDIQKATAKWKGVKIHIEAMIVNRVVTISFKPSAAPLIIEALKEKPRDRKKEKNVSHNGNIKLDDVIRIAKTMRDAERSMAITFTGTVKEILGTCVSLACTIDGKSAKDMTALVESGEVKVE
jgi:large subunit ribosomal protein L12e